MTARGYKKLVSTQTSRTTVVLLFSIILVAPASALPQRNAAWNQGSPNCAQSPQAPLQVHAYDSRTFVLRENLCSTFEAPFLYLLIGSTEALLIDSGDVADPKSMPLADTVMHMLPEKDQARLPLLVAHTHRHSDHRAGDAQFVGREKVQVIGFDLESVRRYYKFRDSPNGIAQINLGDRVVDVIPTPGHSETEVSFYDRTTALFFSGDFLMPGRLLIEDAAADLASAERVAAFVKDRPVSFVLGGHIEMNSAGKLFPWESTYHPQERALPMTKEDLLELPAAIRSFNGIYAVRGQFTMENSMRILGIYAVVALIFLAAVAWLLIRLYFRCRRSRQENLAIQRSGQADAKLSSI